MSPGARADAEPKRPSETRRLDLGLFWGEYGEEDMKKTLHQIPRTTRKRSPQ